MVSWKLRSGSLRDSWGRFLQLTWKERWLLLRVFAWLALIGAGLHLMNFQRLRRLLLRFSRTTQQALNNDSAREQAAVTSRLVQAAACRMPFRATCLVRSTTLWYLLRRQGIDSVIRIGVNREEGEFHAHAWVEIDGMVLNDRVDIHRHYVPFDQVSVPGSTESI